MTRSSMDEDRSEAPAQKVEAEQRPHGEAPQTQVPFSEREVPPPPRKRVFLIVLLVVGGALGYGAFEHFLTDQRATESQAEATDFVPEVTTITAKAEDGPIKLTLPGQTEPFNQSTIYPRATGYIAERRVDIGSHRLRASSRSRSPPRRRPRRRSTRPRPTLRSPRSPRSATRS
jgi:HlyD family secretion protein